MKNLVLISVCIFLMANGAFAMALYTLKGKVTKIEGGRAFVQSETGEKKILLKKLSKKDQQALNEAVSTKKEISLSLRPELLQE